MLLFFSVARSAQSSQAERASEAKAEGAEAPVATPEPVVEENGEKMPTDKILDVSPMALRMSSPFNAGYWLNAA